MIALLRRIAAWPTRLRERWRYNEVVRGYNFGEAMIVEVGYTAAWATYEAERMRPTQDFFDRGVQLALMGEQVRLFAPGSSVVTTSATGKELARWAPEPREEKRNDKFHD